MRLAPRHYVLLLLLIALTVYNVVRLSRARHAVVAPATAPAAVAARSTAPGWAVFDAAAAQRNAPDAQFSPALNALNTAVDQPNAIAIPPTTTPAELTALKGCRTWLLFYRQTVVHPGASGVFSKSETNAHVESCTATHTDGGQP